MRNIFDGQRRNLKKWSAIKLVSMIPTSPQHRQMASASADNEAA